MTSPLQALIAVDLERAIPGSLLHLPRFVEDVLAIVSVDDFVDPFAALAMRGVVELHEQGKPIDVLLLRSHLASTATAWAIQDDRDLMLLLTAPASSLHACWYAREVRELADKRRMALVLDDVQRKMLADEISVDEALSMVGIPR